MCVKEVPSATSAKRLDATTHRLDRSGDSELNPFDLHGLEEAIRIREGGQDVGEIVAVCMGPERSSLWVVASSRFALVALGTSLTHTAIFT